MPDAVTARLLAPTNATTAAAGRRGSSKAGGTGAEAIRNAGLLLLLVFDYTNNSVRKNGGKTTIKQVDWKAACANNVF